MLNPAFDPSNPSSFETGGDTAATLIMIAGWSAGGLGIFGSSSASRSRSRELAREIARQRAYDGAEEQVAAAPRPRREQSISPPSLRTRPARHTRRRFHATGRQGQCVAVEPGQATVLAPVARVTLAGMFATLKK